MTYHCSPVETFDRNATTTRSSGNSELKTHIYVRPVRVTTAMQHEPGLSYTADLDRCVKPNIVGLRFWFRPARKETYRFLSQENIIDARHFLWRSAYLTPTRE